MTLASKSLMLMAIAALACGNCFAQSVSLQKPVPFAPDNDISAAILTDCDMGNKLADAVKVHSSVPVIFIDGSAPPASGRVLELQIVDAVSMGNAWLGHQKFTKVHGTLFQDGNRIAGFKARRNSMGGAFAGFKGSCSVLGRTVEIIGKDIGGWLSNPVDDARLGD